MSSSSVQCVELDFVFTLGQAHFLYIKKKEDFLNYYVSDELIRYIIDSFLIHALQLQKMSDIIVSSDYLTMVNEIKVACIDTKCVIMF